MGYELDRENISREEFRNEDERHAIRRQRLAWAARELAITSPEISLAEYFNSYAWRQMVYLLADPQGLSTPCDPPFTRMQNARVPYHVADIGERRLGTDVVAEFTPGQWDDYMDQINATQDVIMEQFRAGNPPAFAVMEHASRLTGQHHARIFNRRENRLSPLWLPDMDIRSTFSFIKSPRKVWIPDIPYFYTMRHLPRDVIRDRRVHPLLRGPDERITYIGGRLSSLSATAYFEMRGIKADIVGASSVEEWAVDSFNASFYPKHRKPEKMHTFIPYTDDELDNSLRNSTIVIGDTSEADEFDVEAAIYWAAGRMQCYGNFNPQIIIQEAHPRNPQYYERCFRALNKFGFTRVIDYESQQSGNFLMVYELKEENRHNHLRFQKHFAKRYPFNYRQENPTAQPIPVSIPSKIPVSTAVPVR